MSMIWFIRSFWFIWFALFRELNKPDKLEELNEQELPAAPRAFLPYAIRHLLFSPYPPLTKEWIEDLRALGFEPF